MQSVKKRSAGTENKPRRYFVFKKRVFHLCNYGVARIRCAIGAVHVAQRRLRCCGRMLRSDFTRLARLSPFPPQSSSRHRWHTGTEADRRKKERERQSHGAPTRAGGSELSSSNTRTIVLTHRLLRAAARTRAAPRSDNVNPNITFSMGVPVRADAELRLSLIKGPDRSQVRLSLFPASR